jgi:3-methylfumaryl-CoA hydratase
LVFVNVKHEVTGGGTAVDEQDIVYREPASGPTPAAEPAPPEEWDWAWDFAITPTLLFRFSALTYNAHRIHYDRRYATEEEGYPGLVVHGPLQAVALAELCRRHAPDRHLASFTFRALSPAFDDGALLLRGRPDGEAVELAAFDHRGARTMTAEATFAP